MSNAPRAQAMGPLPALIFSSRWLQLPLYLGLIVRLMAHTGRPQAAKH